MRRGGLHDPSDERPEDPTRAYHDEAVGAASRRANQSGVKIVQALGRRGSSSPSESAGRGLSPEEGDPGQTSPRDWPILWRGLPAYREWAAKTLVWLDAKLYRWSVHFTDLEHRRGEEVSNWFFNYDQGILSEANLLAYRLLGRDHGYYERAWSLGRRLDPVLWNKVAGGYNLQAGVDGVYPVYSAWLSQSLLALYEEDGDLYWQERAAANVDALNRAAWDPAHGGYFHAYYLCGEPTKPGCGGGSAWVADTSEKHAVDQAWMQRVQALLATAPPGRLLPPMAPRRAPAQVPQER